MTDILFDFVNDKIDFLKSVQKNNQNASLKLIEKAYDLCVKAHNGQYRKSGEPYATHPIAVARKLIDINMDDTTIIVGLLHDVLEDTTFTKNDLTSIFNEEIANLVDGVTKFEKIKFKEQKIRQVENFRKLFLAISKDVRVLIVKLFDRLHNIETISFHQNNDKIKDIALETIEIYTPLAEKIGLQMVKNDLQNKCFQILYPEEYKTILKRIEIIKNDYKSNNIVEDIIKELNRTMSDQELNFKILGREKNPYSVFMKMKHKYLSLDELSDIIAFRIIVDNVQDCYKTLGIIHTKYKAVPGKFDDYISTPKINNYQSIHTTIMGPKQHLIEIQIRTSKMHAEAEYGLAAHWKYKTTTSSNDQILKLKSAWVYRVLNILEEANDNSNIMSVAKIEIKEDTIYVFNSNGEMIDLPTDATLLDFLIRSNPDKTPYFDHAKIDSEIVNNVGHVLKNGNRIKVVYGEKHTINKDWIKIPITGESKSFLSKFFLI